MSYTIKFVGGPKAGTKQAAKDLPRVMRFPQRGGAADGYYKRGDIDPELRTVPYKWEVYHG